MKAKVVIEESAKKKIEWLTKNFNKEICAFGKVEIRKDENKREYFYIYDLIFPKQEVSSATINVEPNMWETLVKKVGLKELEKINFYWHRHPINATHSSIDEKDTFEPTMENNNNRKYFIFLQTAVDLNNNWNEEIRIELKQPIRATITSDNIDLFYEDKEDIKLKEECEKIIKENVLEKKYDFFNNSENNFYKSDIPFDKAKYDDAYLENLFFPYELSLLKKEDFGKMELGKELNNKDKVENVAEISIITFKDNKAKIICGDDFLEMLKAETTLLDNNLLVKSINISKNNNLNIINLTAKKKKIHNLIFLLSKTYVRFMLYRQDYIFNTTGTRDLNDYFDNDYIEKEYENEIENTLTLEQEQDKFILKQQQEYITENDSRMEEILLKENQKNK